MRLVLDISGTPMAVVRFIDLYNGRTVDETAERATITLTFEAEPGELEILEKLDAAEGVDVGYKDLATQLARVIDLTEQQLAPVRGPGNTVQDLSRVAL